MLVGKDAIVQFQIVQVNLTALDMACAALRRAFHLANVKMVGPDEIVLLV
jgi:hypothetical protein